ncbi:hypothetical protein DF047_36655 [Burkholderia cenocepacia]|nr:hypothetical protein DF047_36655 [Burkholderia cenocepacia]
MRTDMPKLGWQRYVHYLGQCVSIESDHVIAVDLLEAFLGSHFAFTGAPRGEPFATVRLTRRSCPISAARFADGEPVFVRRSASPYFTLPADRLTSDDIEYVRCRQSGTVFAFCGRLITVHLPFDGFALDIIELMRDLFFKRLDVAGTLALHSTALERGGQAVLVVGRKGAGKTTLALRLVNEQGFRFVSGDKAFISVERGVAYVSGWPDYPHIGAGTLKSMPTFAEALGADPGFIATLPDTEKLPLDPGLFRSAVSHASRGRYPVRCVLYPDVASQVAPSMTVLDKHASLLAANIETPFGDTWKWTTFQHPVDHAERVGMAELANLQAWRVNGSATFDDAWFENGRVHA